MLKNYKTKEIENLLNAILCIDNADDLYDFFYDLCTINELQSLSQRFEVALRLDRGETYQEISRESGVSTATISRINRSLNYGSEGYKKTIEMYNRKKEK